METITEDKWDEDIWGIEHEDAGSVVDIPKLVFYFGENVRFCTRQGVWVLADEYSRTTGSQIILGTH
jgi:hypothetical protein